MRLFQNLITLRFHEEQLRFHMVYTKMFKEFLRSLQFLIYPHIPVTSVSAAGLPTKLPHAHCTTLPRNVAFVEPSLYTLIQVSTLVIDNFLSMGVNPSDDIYYIAFVNTL